MTIGELADQAGVTPRTIRYYVEQGVLPAPEYGRPAEYTAEHLRRLDLIRRLKDQYLPLEEIRDIMQRLTLEQVAELAREGAPAAQKAAAHPLTSAADYIAGILGRGATREHMKQQAPPPPPAQAPTLPYGPPPAPPAWQPTPPAWSPVVPAPAPAAPAPPPAGAAPPVPLVPIPAPASDHEESEAPPTTAAAPTTWQRIVLAPGIELHYAATGDARLTHLVARLLEAAGRILGETPEKDREDT